MFRSANDSEGFHGIYDLGFHQDYPPYIFDARQAVYQKGAQNILLLPLSSSNVFTWNYGASTPVSVLLFEQGLFFKSYGEGLIPNNKAEQFLQKLEEYIHEGNVDSFLDILSVLGIDTIIQRNDHRINFYGNTKTTPAYMKQFLKEIDAIEIDSFGKWDVYFDKTKLNRGYSSRHRLPHHRRRAFKHYFTQRLFARSISQVFMSSVTDKIPDR